MYIQPDSTIWLIKDIPLNKDYTDTLWFDSASVQFDWFSRYSQTRRRVLEDYSYQRVNKNKIRVGIKADLLYDYNYMMFLNSAYGYKWFYAFVNSVNYINDNTTELEYEIDVMQTWLFEAELGESYVVREHEASDVAGLNILPEPLTVTNYVCNGMLYDSNFGVETNWYVAVAYSVATDTA